MSDYTVDFNNSKKEEVNRLLRVSAGPGNYQLNTPLNQDNCYPLQPTIRLQKRGVSVVKNHPLIDP